MTRPRTVSFRVLKVHGTPTPPEAGPAPARPRFAELLSRRPSPVLPRPAQPVDNAPRRQREAEYVDAEEELLDGDVDDGPAPSPQRDAPAAAPPDTADPTAMQPVGPESVFTAAVAAAMAATLRDPAIARYVADTVTAFCNDAAVRGGEGWQVSMPLRPDLLPATTLHLSLSPHWLLLRFDSRDERARALLSKHQTTLQTTLEEALVPRREVSITLD